MTGTPRFYESKYGKSGLATVKKTDTGYQLTFDEDKTILNVAQADAPEDIREAQCYITMDENNTEIKFIKPPEKAYFGYFHGFYAKDGELPTYTVKPFSPRTQTRDWDIPEHLEMTVQFRIVDDPVWDGFIISKPFSYAFKEYMDTGICGMTGWGSKKLEGLLNELGFDTTKESIPYSENVLPELQDMLLEKKQKVILKVGKGGWLNQIYMAP